MRYGKIVRLAEAKDAYKHFEALRVAGFDGCQLVFKPEVYTDGDAVQIKAAAEKAGIEIFTIFAGFRDSFTKWNIYSDYLDAGINSKKYGAERVAYLKKTANFARQLGVSDILIHAGFVANNPFSDEYGYMVATLTELASYCRSIGVNILLETGGESPVTLLRLIEDTALDNLFVNLDTANLIMYGYGNPRDAVYTLGGRIRSIHIKDGLPPTTSRELGREVDFGTGHVDFKTVLSDLIKSGYAGPVIIEREINDGRADEEILRTKSELETIFSELSV
ncbi:MAG: sugar phosphate isomerase/epimerase [Clostridia bacterium]|nr:sugar phosphate isomerase/epimerase [Clostridia bacterium]